MTRIHPVIAWSRTMARSLKSRPEILAVAWRVAFLVVGVLMRTIVGALAGWIVGWFFGNTLLAIANQLGIHKVATWQLGAALGFVSGFFDYRFSNPKG